MQSGQLGVLCGNMGWIRCSLDWGRVVEMGKRDGFRSYLGGNFNKIYFDMWSKQEEGVKMPQVSGLCNMHSFI